MNKPTVFVALLFVVSMKAPAMGEQIHNLRAAGNTLIEAEDFSAIADQYPRDEYCEKCSGQRNLGYFWKDRWFEIEVQVTKPLQYNVSLRVSSIGGSNVEMLDMNEDPQLVKRLGIVKVPDTREWTIYEISDFVTVALSQGKHTLRFKNLGEGTNVDFITLTAVGSQSPGDTGTEPQGETSFPFQGSVRPIVNAAQDKENSRWTHLLDSDLSQWEVFMGVPHTSVNVEWPSKSGSGTEGTPLGLNNDPLQVFSVKEVDGKPVLEITGEVYGGLTSRKEYGNYHLSLQFKWGEKKWPPRGNDKRDSGLLIHCVGDHGAFWNVWKRSLECQIQEGDCGDFIALAGSGCNIRVRRIENSDRPQFDPTQPLYHGTGYVTHGPSEEKPNGQWNTIEVYSIGQTSVFVVNGTPNMVLERTVQSTPDGWKPLAKGQLQIQSEAAEIFYRDIKIRQIAAFPESLRSITQPYVGKVEWFE